MSDRHRTGPVVAALSAVALGMLLLPTAVAAQEHERCEDLLVSHAPDGSTGDTSAVAITSQALARDTAGWASVGWQVAPTTDLRAVVAISPDGIAELPATATTVDGPVLELQFCGSAHDAVTTGRGELHDRTAGISSAAVPTTRARTSTSIGASAPSLGILGAALGATGGGLVLLLRRNSRNDHEVVR